MSPNDYSMFLNDWLVPHTTSQGKSKQDPQANFTALKEKRTQTNSRTAQRLTRPRESVRSLPSIHYPRHQVLTCMPMLLSHGYYFTTSYVLIPSMQYHTYQSPTTHPQRSLFPSTACPQRNLFPAQPVPSGACPQHNLSPAEPVPRRACPSGACSQLSLSPATACPQQSPRRACPQWSLFSTEPVPSESLSPAEPVPSKSLFQWEPVQSKPSQSAVPSEPSESAHRV